MRYDIHVHLKPEQVLDAAARFFGPDGRKMTQSARQALQISFFGPGLAWVTCWPPDAKGEMRVDIDSSERDADAVAFITLLQDLERTRQTAAGGPPTADAKP